MCSIVGVASDRDVAEEIYLGLYATRNRGCNSSGIATYQAGDRFYWRRGASDIDFLFRDFDVASLPGTMGIGHNRYATTTSKKDLENDAQPRFTTRPGIAIAYNGHLAMEELKPQLISEGWCFTTNSDVEVLLYAFCQALVELKAYRAQPGTEFFVEKLVPSLRELMDRLSNQGAYSVVALLDGYGLVGFTDPHGIRPLSFARKATRERSYAFASETTALNLMRDYTEIRPLEPGEVVYVDMERNVHTAVVRAKQPAFCAFEPVYFAETDSVLLGQHVYEIRQKLGSALAEEFPELREKVDVVCPVPDTPIATATRLATLWDKAYGGIIKRAAIRSFQQPSQELRELAADLKYIFVKPSLEGKRVCLVDDSIVRGTTLRKMVRRLRGLGALEVHTLITFPPFRNPCLYGIDIPTRKNLIAARHGGDIEKIRAEIGADSLHYLSKEALVRVLGRPGGLCMACVDGHYVDRKPAEEAMIP